MQQRVIDIIIEEGRKIGFNNREIACYLAIAKRQSGFHPDAANTDSTASGIAQVTDSTARQFGIDDSNRFNARASIRAGLQYLKRIRNKAIKESAHWAADPADHVRHVVSYRWPGTKEKRQ
ncbi:transglycosylase-like protein with SLT domain [Pseudoduganella lurida]|uniref:Transglycosylase-like protein with SLT domain n=1 Tax=Pseudoduganella lurida TaxID=1036180 RepID=A0A562RL76_9BURK|nr:transglycosylase-like protein with SLT domain [Pseudoduganella lurida]